MKSFKIIQSLNHNLPQEEEENDGANADEKNNDNDDNDGDVKDHNNDDNVAMTRKEEIAEYCRSYTAVMFSSKK